MIKYGNSLETISSIQQWLSNQNNKGGAISATQVVDYIKKATKIHLKYFSNI